MIYGKEMTNDKTDEFEAMLMAAQEERESDACLKGETKESEDGDSSGTIQTHDCIRTRSSFSVMIQPCCAVGPSAYWFLHTCVFLGCLSAGPRG